MRGIRHIRNIRLSRHGRACPRSASGGLGLLRALGFAVVLVSLLTVLPTASVQAGENESSAVGEVSLVLGRAYLERNGEREKIVTGAQINVGDRVFTEAGGHVHVHFIDDALVSVRPSSTLDIVRYDYDAQQPQNSAVKFELSEGVARAISGAAAKSARERFRLNTPIAAIGVRGTDFVVSANSRTTRALVNEGSIVMAPFSNECSSEALGPCATDAVELSQTPLQMLEIDDIARAPRLVANASMRSRAALGAERLASAGESQDESNGDSLAQDAQLASANTDTALDSSANSIASIESSEVYLESVANEKISNEVAAASSASQTGSELPAALPDFTPSVALTLDDTADSALVWGRWGEGFSAGNLLSLELADARVDRNVTVGTFTGFILYRDEPNGARVDSNLGVVKFDLAQAEAYLDVSSGMVAMRVGGGDLELDFVNNAFATSLNLDHALTGAIDFLANGRIADGGYLSSTSEGQSVSGAVATDGSAAAYHFEQQIEQGSIQGLTLWGAQ